MTERSPEKQWMRISTRAVIGLSWATAVAMSISNYDDIKRSMFPSCTEPSQADFDAVTSLLDSQRGTEIIDPESKNEIQGGLNTYDPWKLYDHALESIGVGDNTYDVPVETFIHNATEFASLYGVKLEFPSESEQTFGTLNEPEYLPLSSKDYQDPTMKNAMYTTMLDLAAMPVELVKYSGITTIRFVRIEEAGTYGSHTTGTDVIYIDPTRVFTAEGTNTLGHEFFHAIDAKQCDDITRDDAYASIGPSDQYDDPEKYSSVEDIESLNTKITLSRVAVNLEKAERLRQERAAILPNVVTASPYGLTEVAEDKATMAEYLFDRTADDGVNLLGGKYPVIRAKLTYLLARIYADEPDIATYIIDQEGYS
jgi:hypothetical protein